MNQKCPNCHKLIPDGSRFCGTCGHDLSFVMPADGILPPGTTIRGTYVIEHMVGEGGMGVVYACRHKTLDKIYALKVLEPKYARMTALRTRFLSEGKIQAKLAHPHIVKVIDVIDNEKDGGFLAIVMEYVQGDSLDQIIKRGLLSEFDAVSTALVMLDAIGYAHHSGIVHRDLKPSNVMVCDDTSRDALYNGIKVMDFGIAKLLETDQQSLTMTGSTIGTPLYMPPEQIETPRNIDARADLYAIGITLYEMLCGRTPFQEYREFDLFRAQLNMQPPSMKNFRRDISDRLEAIIMKALEKDRENRYRNAEEFQRALLSLGGYDDIPLLLNPYEGTSIQPKNSLLQNKIRNVINKTARQPEESSPEKEIQARNLARAVAQAVAEQPETMGKSAGRKRTSVPEPAVEPESKAMRNQREKQPPSKRESAGTSANLMTPAIRKATQTSTTSKKSGKKNQSDEVKRPSPRPRQPAKQTELHETATAGDTSNKRSNAQQSRSRRDTKASQSPQHVARNEANPREVESEPRAAQNRIRLAVIIALLILLMLGAASLVYRTDAGEYVAVTDNPEVKSEPEVHTVVEDVSKLPLETLTTPTGIMTHIPAARHLVSTDKPNELRQIDLDSYYIDQTEVPYYEYEKCVDAGKCPPTGVVPESPNLPVTNVGFASALAFCEYAGKRLPDRAQWEAAARFGGKTNGITYVNVSCSSVNYGSSGECRKQNPKRAQSVYSFANGANPGHLRNMLGNVREWVNEPDSSRKKMLTKGGSYLSDKTEINISANKYEPINQGAPDIGFRCVKD